jgi:hypothetical protein
MTPDSMTPESITPDSMTSESITSESMTSEATAGGADAPEPALTAASASSHSTDVTEQPTSSRPTSSTAPDARALVDRAAHEWGLAVTAEQRACVVDRFEQQFDAGLPDDLQPYAPSGTQAAVLANTFAGCRVDILAASGAAARPIDVIMDALLRDEDVTPTQEQVRCVSDGFIAAVGGERLLDVITMRERAQDIDEVAVEVFTTCGLDGDALVNGTG